MRRRHIASRIVASSRGPFWGGLNFEDLLALRLVQDGFYVLPQLIVAGLFLELALGAREPTLLKSHVFHVSPPI